MSNSRLLIPDDLKVGFQEREDTYTDRLAYVIYYDQTGKLRKESSWQKWRSNDIEPQDIKNTPTEGFVLNRNVGGVSRYSRSWDMRMEKCRVYDPRGWEFEITIPNLLFILQECTSTKGKGLEGEFVYGWSGTELVLLPVTSKEYKESQKFTKLQAKKISTKELIVGATYHTKQQENWVYLGRFDWYEGEYEYISKRTNEPASKRLSRWNVPGGCYETRWYKKIGKKYVFVSLHKNEYRRLEKRTDVTNLAAVVDEKSPDNFSELFEVFSKSEHASFYTGLVATPIPAEKFTNIEESKRIRWHGHEEDNFTDAFNNMHPVTINADGTYTMYKVKQYQVLDPEGKKDQWGNTLYIHQGGYVLTPIKKIWFKDGRKWVDDIDKSQVQFDTYGYNPRTGRREHFNKPDNMEWNEQVVLQPADFVNVGFHKLEVEFESKIKNSVKEY